MFNIIYNIVFYVFILLGFVFLGFGVTSIDYILISIGVLFGLASILMAFENQ